MGQTVDRDEMKGALWPKTSKRTGKVYHSGTIKILGDKYNVAMFLNERRENDKQPEYNLVISVPGQNNGDQNDTSG